MKFTLSSQRFDVPAGTVVYPCRGHDYGLANDDTRATGISHVSVTLNPDGGYPFFTVPKAELREVTS